MSLIEAVATKLMRMLKIGHNVIINISKNSSSNFSTSVLLSLGTPIFKAHTLCFKIASLCIQRRVALLDRNSLLLRGDNSALKFHDSRVQLLKIAESEQRLRDILKMSKARE